jgi:hypothetical protein
MHEQSQGPSYLQRLTLRRLLLTTLIGLSMASIRPAYAQAASADSTLASLPAAPDPAQQAAQQPAQPASNNPTPMDTTATVHPSHFLSLRERFLLQSHTTFGPITFISPAGEAAITMAHPPDHYPREWRDGGGAYARNYGSEFARHSAGGLGHFATAFVDGEDPRYFRSVNQNFGRRAAHSMIFTLFDRTNSGHRTVALSNIAGSAAAGFVGNLWEPDGFNDNTHALQRSALEFGTFGAANLFAEFSPDISRLLHKMRFPDRLADAMLPRSYQAPPLAPLLRT